MNINDEIKRRIEETKNLLEKIKNKTTLTYLEGLYSLKCDCETVEDYDSACKYADMIIDLLSRNAIEYPDNAETREKVNKMWVTSYDTKARQGDFEAFCIAMEWNRPIEKQYYLPRMRILKKHGVIQAVQDLLDDKLDLLVINMPPRAAKTTTGMFLQALIGGMYPDDSILSASYNIEMVNGLYDEIIDMTTNTEKYRYHEIFPNNKIADKSAEYRYLDLNQPKRMHTYNYVSIETGATGKAEAKRLLYCDDLVKGVEQANNPDQLDKLYRNYTGTLKDRLVPRLCKDGVYRDAPEIHINTPWSLHDVTSRVIEDTKRIADKSRIRIISIPCYDENGESNFMYDYGNALTVKHFKNIENSDDPVIFSAKYLMQPIERDGLVFNKENISFYNELPGDEPDRIVAYADVSHGGDDYFSLPIAYVYGNEVYIEKVLFRHKFGGDDYIRPLVRDIIMTYKVTRCGVEKNNGGDYFMTLMNKDLKEKGYHCNLTNHNAPTNKRKLDRILACQNEIKGIAMENHTFKLYFKDPELIKGDKDYLDAMQNLYTWNQNPSMQNKQHDDFPDSLAGLITNVLGGKSTGVAKSTVTAAQLGI